MTLAIDFEANPLVPAVIQDDESRDVLMVGFMNELAYQRTLETGFVHFWSRSRNQLWRKGETSGHTQEVVSMSINCEDNSLLVQVIQEGAVCHTGHRTCYYRQILPDGSLFETSDPVFDPAAVYARPTSLTVQLWYGAYEYLRDHDLSDVSGTSLRIRTSENVPFDRVGEELAELAGVLTGNHVHKDFESDVILESSQVLYWVAVCGVISRLRCENDLGISAGLNPMPAIGIEEWTITGLLEQAATMRNGDLEEFDRELGYTVQLVGDAVARAGIQPLRLIETDLAELRAKPYLADYFSSIGA